MRYINVPFTYLLNITLWHMHACSYVISVIETLATDLRKKT